MSLNRDDVETIIVNLLDYPDKLTKEEREAILFLIRDFHKMCAIEDIVK